MGSDSRIVGKITCGAINYHYITNMTLTPDQFESFQDLAWNINGEVYENYSGRRMYGKTCLGITVENLNKALFSLGRYTAEPFDEDLASAVERFETDNMDRSYIIYFPKIQKAVDGE